MSGSSDRKINYSLRPSKSIERKMILEVLKELCTPKKSKEYRYVGFGASFFTDFKLFHRGLNITDMISIESKKSNAERVEYNKPYACITIEIGDSTSVLPRLPWDKKTIAWMDYETSLKNNMFNDIDIISRNVKNDSVMLITLRRDFVENTTKEDFEREFGDNVLPGLLAEDLEPSRSSSTINKMFINKINDVLLAKYSASEPEDKMIFKQLFDLTYRDDAKMYTFGGVFIRQSDELQFDEYNFNNLDFIGKKDLPYDISFPIITNKEFHKLTNLLPAEKEVFLSNEEIAFIPKEHKESYFNTYKYYPAYIEIMDM